MAPVSACIRVKAPVGALSPPPIAPIPPTAPTPPIAPSPPVGAESVVLQRPPGDGVAYRLGRRLFDSEYEVSKPRRRSAFSSKYLQPSEFTYFRNTVL